jgi:carbamoyl-phosphate synthase large subunit
VTVDVLLTCAGRKSYLVPLLRSSARCGRLIAADLDPRATLRHHVDAFRAVPPVSEPEAYVEALLALCRDEGVSAILPQNDLDLGVLARFAGTFAEAGVRVLGAPEAVVAAVGDKLRLADWLAEHDLPSVPTRELDGDDPGFPLMAKARVGQGSVGLRRVDGPDDLARLPPGSVVQPLLDGDEYNLDVLRDGSGTVVSVVPKRKLSMFHGSTERAFSVRSDDLVELGVRIGDATAHTGGIDVDLFVTSGGPRVIDINPRLGGGFPFTAQFCPRYVDALLAIAAGEPVRPFLGAYDADREIHRESLYAAVSPPAPGPVGGPSGGRRAPPSRRERLCVVVPCKNEEAGVVRTVEDIPRIAGELPLEARLILVDDGSTDGTLGVMRELQREHGCEVLVNERNLGLGRTVQRAWEIMDDDDWATVMPGDNEIFFDSIHNFLEVRDGFDVILGYTHNPVVRTFMRRAASTAFMRIVNALYGFRYRYLNGMKMYRVRAFKGIDVRSAGHAFNGELMAKALLRDPHLRVGEVPFYWRGRSAGQSKAIRPFSVLAAIRDVVTGVSEVNRYRQRVLKDMDR